jgi:hypothetical protein
VSPPKALAHSQGERAYNDISKAREAPWSQKQRDELHAAEAKHPMLASATWFLTKFTLKSS